MLSDNHYTDRKYLGTASFWQNGGPKLPKLDIELTERCNNSCIHCYINQPENGLDLIKREMTFERITEIINDAAALGCMIIRFTGGEPLLRPDFQKIYIYTKRQGIRVILFTNATLITTDLCELFQKYPPGEPIEITLYGMSQVSYESVSRVKGSYDKAMNGIQLLTDSNIPLVLKSIKLPGRDVEAHLFQDYSKKHSINRKKGRISTDFNLRARRDNPEKNLKIAKIRATPQEMLKQLIMDSENFIRSARQFAEKFMRPEGDDLFTCGCGNGGAVDAYGVYQPCLLLRHPDMVYDLNNGSLEDALDNFFPKVLKRAATNPEYRHRCAKCFLKNFCNQCPAWSYMENGTLDSPVEYLCSVTHEQAYYLGLIKKGEKSWNVINWQTRIDNFINRSS